MPATLVEHPRQPAGTDLAQMPAPMMAAVNRLLFALLLLAVGFVAGCLGVSAQDVPSVEVIVLEGPLDPQAIRFVESAVQQAAEGGSQAVIVQLDSPGALDAGIEDVIALFRRPPLPLTVWVGEAPAVAFGGAVQLLMAAAIRTAAPGVEIGNVTPLVAGSSSSGVAGPPWPFDEAVVRVEEPLAGVVEAVLPSIGQVVVWLDGREVSSARGPAVLDTARREVAADGTARLVPIAPVTFREPGLFARILRVSVSPAAAFFFFVMGLVVAAFEFFAVGPGLAAAVGAGSILLGGYGLAVLPVRWWALVVIGLALLVLTVEFQRRSFGVLSLLAAAALAVAGMFLTGGAPQIRPSPWGVGLTVAMVVFFYLVAMPVVARSRFSTGTIGREYLLGRAGTAVTDLTPGGVVEIDGARWKGRSHREAGIVAGDGVVVEALEGTVLRVDREKTS